MCFVLCFLLSTASSVSSLAYFPIPPSSLPCVCNTDRNLWQKYLLYTPHKACWLERVCLLPLPEKTLQYALPEKPERWEINGAVIAGQCFWYYALSQVDGSFPRWYQLFIAETSVDNCSCPWDKAYHRVTGYRRKILPHASFRLFSNTLKSMGYHHL